MPLSEEEARRIGHEKGKLQYECARKAVEYMVLADDIRRTINYLSILEKLPTRKALPVAREFATDLLADLDKPSVKNVDPELLSKVREAIQRGLNDPDEVLDVGLFINTLPEETAQYMLVDVAGCECGEAKALEEHVGQEALKKILKPTRDEVELHTWCERDRLSIELRNKADDTTVAIWWDDDARQMFEDGFFKGGVPTMSWERPSSELIESVMSYAEDMGILAK